MIRNYFKVAWRNLIKSKGYSAINIGGLSVGMAVAMLIGLWVHDELTFNQYHKNYSRIAQVWQHANFNGKWESQTANPALMGQELRAKFGSNFKYVVQASWLGGHYLTVGNQTFEKTGMYFEPDAPEMLSLKMLRGTRAGLKDPYSIMLSSSVATALYGKEDPVNKIIKFDREHSVKVTGVYEDLPDNTTFKKVSIIMPWDLWLTQNKWAKDMEYPWGSNFSQTFVQIADNSDMKSVSAKIRNVKMDNVGADEKKYQWIVFLHPMSKWNLYSDFKDGVNKGGKIQYVWLFGIIGIFVLMLACINFMNLATARSEKRAREVGIRKAIGSLRWQIIKQFFAESYLVVLLAFVLSIALVLLLLPMFNEVGAKKMEIPWGSSFLWISIFIFILLTGLLAGSYPALYLSSFQPLKVLKGTFRVGKMASVPRKILVVVQFACSVILMIGTVVIYEQIQYGKNQPIGFNNRGLITVNWSDDISKNFDALKQELLSTGAAVSVCQSNSPPSEIYSNNNGWEWKNSQPIEQTVIFSTITTTYDYTKTLGIKLLSGRDFSKDFADSASVVLNEAAVKRMGLKNPVGEQLKWNGTPMTVIGVIPDIQMESPYRPISPLTIIFNKGWVSYVDVRLNPQMSASKAISLVKPIFDKYNPAYPFEYKFADEEYAKKFNYEELVGNLAAIIAVLAVFISCLGLFGLASFTAEQRVKEIGVRKVLGASVFNLWKLLSKDFVILVLTACVIAIPIAYYGMNEWLKSYEHKISIGISVFVSVVAAAIAITLITVSFQAIKAALENPVKSLRTE